jgi:Flp pilus assembly protein TadD
MGRLSLMQEAIASTRTAVYLTPHNSDGYFNLGVMAQDAGDTKEAARSYELAVALNPHHDSAHNNLGLIHFVEHRGRAAVHHFQAAIAAVPGSAVAWANVARAFAIAKEPRVEEASRASERALSLDPTRADAYHALGLVSTNAKLWHEAVANYTREVQLEPYRQDALVNLGYAAKQCGQLHLACTSYLRAVELNPTEQARAYYNLGELLFASTLPDETQALMPADATHAKYFERSQAAALTSANKYIPGRRATELHTLAISELESERCEWALGDWLDEPSVEIGLLVQGGDAYASMLDASATDQGYIERDVYLVMAEEATVVGAAAVIVLGCKIFRLVHAVYTPLIDVVEIITATSGERGRHLELAGSVLQMSAANFYHWTAECVVRLLYMRPLLRQTPSMALLVPGERFMRRSIDETIAALGLDTVDTSGARREVVYWSSNADHEHSMLLVRRLYTVDWRLPDTARAMEGGGAEERASAAFFPPRHGLRLLRSTFMRAPPADQQRVVVFCSRGLDEAPRRKMGNEMEAIRALIEIAAPLEVVVFHGANTTLSSSIELFAKARLVVAMHGAALTNIVYCAKGSAVIEVAIPVSPNGGLEGARLIRLHTEMIFAGTLLHDVPAYGSSIGIEILSSARFASKHVPLFW